MPAQYTAVSNGRLVSDTRSAGQRTMRWSQDRPSATYLVSLVIAFTLAQLIGESTTSYGLKIGAGVGAGVGAAILAQNYAYESRSLKFWLINAVYVIVGLAAMGVIVGWFQRS